jgi:transforming growth factor-beta-induced protein
MNKHSLTTLLALSCTLSCAFAQNTTEKTIVQVATEAGSFHTLVAAVKAAGLAETLSGTGPFTVFAPTDEAFAKLGKDAIADLLKPENKQKLASVLTFHVVAGKLPAAKVVTEKTLKSLQGQDLTIRVDGSKVMVGSANVVKTDVMGSNGVIHVIDAVLMPVSEPNLVEVATKAGKFGTLLKAAVAAGLADTLANGGPFTVFAPTDEAFAALGDATIADLLKPDNKAKLASILKNHVVAGKVMAAQAVKLTEAKTIGGTTLALAFDGKVLKVGTAKVVSADVVAGNGVIHVIDAVLVPAN